MSRTISFLTLMLSISGYAWADIQFDDLQFPPTSTSHAAPGITAAAPNPAGSVPYNPYFNSPYTASSYPYGYNVYPYGQPMLSSPQALPAPQNMPPNKPKPWGDTRNIWPDFYTDMTSEMWDKMMNAPHDMGYMPGGWRFPSLSSPDPITVGDAVANQVPPIMEEVPNFMNFTQ